MKNAFVLIFLSFIILGIALSPMGILAGEDDSDNSGSSDKKIRVREETKREFRTDDGGRIKIERKVEIENGEIKIRIKRKVIDAEGNEIEVRIVIEKDKDGIKKKIKIEGVEGLEVNTELEIDDEFKGNESELIAIMSNGKRAKIKIMPDQLVEIALERLKARDFTMELKEIRYGTKLRVIYNVEANKTGRFLGILKLKLKLEGQIDPETGELIRINKPWWAFLVAGEDNDQVGKKTTLCHIPKGDPSAAHTISVGAPAVKAHLGRHGGDTLGACAGGGTPPGNETEPPENNETIPPGNETGNGGDDNQTGDTQSPQWFNNSTNSILNGTLIEHSVRWTDDVNLSGFIFSFDNGAGTFINDSFIAMLGTEDWSNISKVVNSTAGTTIRWRVYANDTSDNWNETEVFSYNTTT